MEKIFFLHFLKNEDYRVLNTTYLWLFWRTTSQSGQKIFEKVFDNDFSWGKNQNVLNILWIHNFCCNLLSNILQYHYSRLNNFCMLNNFCKIIKLTKRPRISMKFVNAFTQFTQFLFRKLIEFLKVYKFVAFKNINVKNVYL